jgi:hypothetical protein
MMSRRKNNNYLAANNSDFTTSSSNSSKFNASFPSSLYTPPNSYLSSYSTSATAAIATEEENIEKEVMKEIR